MSKTALILGVANHRSIAWACVKSFIQRDYNVIFTYQNERFAKTANDLIADAIAGARSNTSCNLTSLACNVEDELPILFNERLPEVMGDGVKLDAIVHSVAYAPPDAMKSGSLLTTSRSSFLLAHDISSYSFLETAQCAQSLLEPDGSSLTTISYLGAVRAIPHYNVMGPVKASLESLVRGLASELGPRQCRVNAVSAGPLSTLAARGITGISDIRSDVECKAPLRRNVIAEEVADTVRFVATEATGITGQTIYVDAGYSIASGPSPSIV